ncbi:MAG: sodium:proline symporter, partial [Candidatus Marinimicrobia bacterium]|nr:sodium:proline symporter [Candidatus Neomarinimicrobiota bacterium]
YRRVHPGGVLWEPVARELPDVVGDSGYYRLLLDWAAGCVMVMCALFGIGHLLVGSAASGIQFLLIAAGAAGVIFWHMSRFGWEKMSA